MQNENDEKNHIQRMMKHGSEYFPSFMISIFFFPVANDSCIELEVIRQIDLCNRYRFSVLQCSANV